MKKRVTDYTLDPQIQKGIENQNREEIKRQIDRNKKKQKKERILTTLIIIFIIAITCVLLIDNAKKTNKAIDKCIIDGHSENYCYEKLA